MSRAAWIRVACGLALVSWIAHIGTAVAEEAGVTISATMANGSVVKGSPESSEVQLATPYGVLRVPLAALTEITLSQSQGKAQAVLVFKNKDRVSGSLDAKELRVTSPYGPLALPVSEIRRLSVAAAAPKSGPRSDAVEEGLRMHYTFDAAGETLLQDHSGNDRHGTSTGEAKCSEDGHPGGSLDCDGRWSFLALQPAGQLLASNLTMAAWVMSRAQQYAPVLEFSMNNYQYGPHLWVTTEGRVYMNFWGRPGNDRTVTTPPGVVKQDEWVHVACVYDGRRGIVYINGEESGDQTFETLTLELSYPFYVGARQGWSGGNTVFDGLVDDVRVYTRALQPEEIRALASAP